MVLDLTGVLHRTVYVSNIEDGFEESVAQLMATRAGDVEQWERGITLPGSAPLPGLTLVFASMNSVSTALQFNRLPFAGNRLLVWQGNKDRPSEILMLDYNASNANQDQASEQQQQEKVARIRDALAALQRVESVRRAEAIASGTHDMSRVLLRTEAERDEFLKQHAYRQVRALTTIIKDETEKIQNECVGVRERILEVLHAGRRPTPATPPVPLRPLRATPVLFDAR